MMPKNNGDNWTDEFFGEEIAEFHRSIGPDFTARQVEFVLKRTGVPRGARILDVCCGEGRHALELSRRGYAVVGIDSNKDYLSRARHLARDESLPVEFVQMDARELLFGPRFELAINLWTSFGYYDDQTNASILQRMWRSLVSGGKIFMEMDNRDNLMGHSMSTTQWRIDDRVTIVQEHNFDYSTSVNRSTWTFIRDGRVIKKFPYFIRVYSCHEIISLLKRTGFGSIEVFGDLKGNPISCDSSMIRVLATAC